MTALRHRGLDGEYVLDGTESFVMVLGVTDFITARVDDGADMAAVFRGLVDEYLAERDGADGVPPPEDGAKQNGDFGEPYDKDCPYCESTALKHTVERQAVRFAYGPGNVLMATVEALVPVTTCTACGEAWTDGRAESVRDEAVERRRAELNA